MLNVGRRAGSILVEYRYPAALPLEEIAVYVVVQDRTTPAVLDRRPNVPFPLQRALDPIEKKPTMAPGNLGHKLWHY